MKRMKKRKIHPDLEGKLVKKEGTITTSTPTVLACFKTHHGLNDSASLLQTRGIYIYIIASHFYLIYYCD